MGFVVCCLYHQNTFVIQDDSYKLHRLEDGPSKEVELSRDDVLKFYRQMSVIREMELEARELYQSKKIRGFLHLFVGQVCLHSTYCVVAK